MSRALGKLGRFVILNHPVTSSGRKVRAYRAGELAGAMARLMLRGPRSVRDRGAMSLWYGERRPDPGDAQPNHTPELPRNYDQEP
jgi:hypothetical protein